MTDPGEGAGADERRALLRVVRGKPTDAEVAALTVALTALSPVTGEEPTRPSRSTWNDPASRLRTQLRPGPDAWRTSAWPR